MRRHVPAKGQKGFYTKSGHRTIGDEVRALMSGEIRDRPAYAMQISVPADITAGLVSAASDRGMTPAKLARAILIAVIEDGLFAAVLDD